MRLQLQIIDAVKGLLCLVIFCHHAAGCLSRTAGLGLFFAHYGSMAVSFFFVISGALVALHYKTIEGFADYRKMLFRRFMRFWPLHVSLMLICIIAFLLTGHSFAGYSTTFLRTLPGFLLVHDWFPFHPEIRQCWDGVSWYLSALFFCYLVYPFFLNRNTSRDWLLPMLIGVVEILFILNERFRFFNAREFVYFFPPTRFLEFLSGALVARTFLSFWQCKLNDKGGRLTVKCFPFPVTREIWGLIILLPAFVFGIVTDMSSVSLGFAFVPLFSLLVFLFLVIESSWGVGGLAGYWLKPFVYVGRISFEFYMLHAIILGAVCTYVPTTHPSLVLAPLALAGTILASHLLHVLCRWNRRREYN